MSEKPHIFDEIADTPVQHNAAQPDRRELLKPDDIESIYGIPKSTQAKGRMTGNTFPYIKRGRSVYAFRDDVEDWLRGLRRRSTSDTGSQQPAQCRG